MRYALLLVAAFGLVACTAPADSDSATASAASPLGSPPGATIAFGPTGWPQVSGPLAAGARVRIAYEPSRLATCRGDLANGPGWSITGFYRMNGGAIATFEAGGFSPSHGTEEPVLALASAGDLEMWFENTSVWGCDAYDSSYGRNYHFTVAAGSGQATPGWIGNAQAITSRATCDGAPCDGDAFPLERGLTFDTWTRQRAAIAVARFEVWSPGVTDRDNPDLWKQLDVEVHSRVGDGGPFATAYVSFDRRVGNNARYALPLRSLDPLPTPPGGAPLTRKDECPPFALTTSADGQYVQADVQAYFTVNGVELRPAAGAVYHATYANYRALYAVCLD